MRQTGSRSRKQYMTSSHRPLDRCEYSRKTRVEHSHQVNESSLLLNTVPKLRFSVQVVMPEDEIYHPG